MASLGTAVFSLTTDSTKFDKGMDSAEQKTGKLGGTMGKLSGVGTILGGVMTGAVVGGLSDAANAAALDEASVLKLQKAVENSGVSWTDNAEKINARIKAGQNLAFTDDQVRDSLALLTAQTGSVDEAMRRQTIAMDLSRGAAIPLETASRLLGKVTAENANVLARYGITMKEGATETELFAALQQKFGGQAQVYGDSTAGAIFKVKDSISEWRESIGAAFGPATGLIALLPGMQSGMLIAGTAVTGLSSLMKGTMIPSFLATHPVIASTLFALGPIILIAAAIGLAILALKFAWENNLGDIQGKTQAVFGVLEDVFEGIKAVATTVFRGILRIVSTSITGVVTIVNGFIDRYNAMARLLGLPILGKIEVALPNIDAIENRLNMTARSRTSTITTIHRAVYEKDQVRDPDNTLVGGSTGYAHGTDYVPATGLALVHQGEAIIPAAQNIASRESGETVTNIYLDGRVIATAVGSRINEQRRLSGAMA